MATIQIDGLDTKAKQGAETTLEGRDFLAQVLMHEGFVSAT